MGKFKELEQFALEHLKEHGLNDWIFKFDNSKRRYGVCKIHKKLISISTALTRLNPVEETKDTILHEIAHALTSRIGGHGHGTVWKLMAKKIGARPERGYNSSKVITPEPDYIYACGKCGYQIKRFKRMFDYADRWHRKCGEEQGKLIKIR